MPKSASAKEKEQLNRLFAKYNIRLGKLYSSYVKRLASLGYGEDMLEGDALFNFDNFPELKARLNDIFNDYFQNSLMLYKQGITDGVTLAYTHDNDALSNYTILSDKALQTARKTAAATFIGNRLNSKKGLNLAQTVWNYCSQTKSEFEMAMSNAIADGIKHGTSAEDVGKTIRKYLNNPDMMYRRYHTIKVQKNGKKKDVVTWRRRRIIDGKVRFVEEPLEKVGMGVYRSSRKNALRVARTEINAAYHKARNERWANEPFVIGQYIHVSPQHTIEDICDEVEGRYPKDFVWTSWHSQCICTSDPIMIDGEEKKEFYRRLMNGEDMSGYVSPYAVKDVPDKYKQYIIDNQDAIVRAVKKDKLAWHLADNKKYWTGLLSKERREELGLTSQEDIRKAILDKAKLRHSQRTQEQAQKIQNAWDARRRENYNKQIEKIIGTPYIDYYVKGDLYNRYYAGREAIKNRQSASDVNEILERFKRGWKIKQMSTDRKIAMNVLKVAQKYGETDITAVQAALDAGEYAKAREKAKQLAKTIKAIQDDEAQLSKIIPDVNTWHKQFTSKQLHEVYNAVESKLAQWSTLTLEEKQKKLHFEAVDFLGGNIHGVQQKYVTWQVSQSAYLKELDVVNTAIEWVKIHKELPDLYSYAYATQSKIYHKLIYDLKNAVAANDKDLAIKILDEAKNKKQALFDAKLKRASKNVINSGSVSFDTDAYSQARKDAAMWAQDTKEADKVLRKVCGDVWRNATEEEKDAIFGYTQTFKNVNEPLRGLTYIGTKDKIKEGLDRIPLMESIISRSSYNTDMWLQRGGELVEFKKFGLANYNTATDAEIKALVGKTGTDGAFTSAGVAKGKGLSGEVILNIYAPRGTKMMYAEPFSHYGDGAKRAWNGISKQSSFGIESEVILQRGTTYRITKVEKSGRHWYVDVEVINQDVLPFPYVGGYPYK